MQIGDKVVTPDGKVATIDFLEDDYCEVITSGGATIEFDVNQLEEYEEPVLEDPAPAVNNMRDALIMRLAYVIAQNIATSAEPIPEGLDPDSESLQPVLDTFPEACELMQKVVPVAAEKEDHAEVFFRWTGATRWHRLLLISSLIGTQPSQLIAAQTNGQAGRYKLQMYTQISTIV